MVAPLKAQWALSAQLLSSLDMEEAYLEWSHEALDILWGKIQDQEQKDWLDGEVESTSAVCGVESASEQILWSKNSIKNGLKVNISGFQTLQI